MTNAKDKNDPDVVVDDDDDSESASYSGSEYSSSGSEDDDSSEGSSSEGSDSDSSAEYTDDDDGSSSSSAESGSSSEYYSTDGDSSSGLLGMDNTSFASSYNSSYQVEEDDDDDDEEQHEKDSGRVNAQSQPTAPPTASPLAPATPKPTIPLNGKNTTAIAATTTFKDPVTTPGTHREMNNDVAAETPVETNDSSTSRTTTPILEQQSLEVNENGKDHKLDYNDNGHDNINNSNNKNQNHGTTNDTMVEETSTDFTNGKEKQQQQQQDQASTTTTRTASTLTAHATLNGNTLILLISSVRSASLQRQDRLGTMLEQLHLPAHEIKVVDGSTPEARDERDALFAISDLRGVYPQVFLQKRQPRQVEENNEDDQKNNGDNDDGTILFVGDFDTMEYLNDNGILAQRLGIVQRSAVTNSQTQQQLSNDDNTASNGNDTHKNQNNTDDTNDNAHEKQPRRASYVQTVVEQWGQMEAAASASPYSTDDGGEAPPNKNKPRDLPDELPHVRGMVQEMDTANAQAQQAQAQHALMIAQMAQQNLEKRQQRQQKQQQQQQQQQQTVEYQDRNNVGETINNNNENHDNNTNNPEHWNTMTLEEMGDFSMQQKDVAGFDDAAAAQESANKKQLDASAEWENNSINENSFMDSNDRQVVLHNTGDNKGNAVFSDDISIDNDHHELDRGERNMEEKESRSQHERALLELENDSSEKEPNGSTQEQQPEESTHRDNSEVEPFLDEEMGIPDQRDEEEAGDQNSTVENGHEERKQEEESPKGVPCGVYVAALMIGEVIGVVVGWYVWIR